MLTIKYKYTKSASTLGRAMIQNGDKFTVLDLCESVRLATSADLRQHIANIKKTPAEYDKMYTEQLVFKNWYANKYNIDTGCLVLCLEHRTKLSKILTRTDTPYVIQLLRRLIPTRLR